MSSSGVVDDWEVAPSTLEFTELLGEGAFGKVMKANFQRKIQNNENETVVFENQIVAVKMVPDNCEDTLAEDFIQEIAISKRMGRHPCLVNMIACIIHNRPFCLIVEFCEKGDLLSFLIDQRKQLQSDGKTLKNFTYIDLLTMAKQIALGMEFISVRGFIHRDLACRNVMVDANNNAKIGDFGLARYGYDNNIYLARLGRALPIRWMPPEAIYDRQFTSTSDV